MEHPRGPRSDADGSGELARRAQSAGSDPETLRREVSLFRLALDADLTVAAAAVDSDAPEIAAQVLDDERRAVRDFSERLLAQVSAGLPPAEEPTEGTADLPAAPTVPLPRSRGLRRPGRSGATGRGSARHLSAAGRRTAVVAVAAALVGGAGGMALAARSGPSSRPTTAVAAPSTAAAAAAAVQTVSAQQQLAATQAQALAAAARAGLSAAQISAAAVAFTTSVGPLLAQAPHDPAVARALWQLLVGEQAALRSSDTREPAIASALRSTEALLRQLQAAVPATVLLAPTVAAGAASTPAAPAPATSTKPSSPAATPSSPQPTTGSSTPSPTRSPGGGILPLPSAGDASTGLGLG